MFKRLRERITEEAITRVGQYGFNQSPGCTSTDSSAENAENVTEDLITLSDSSSVVVPHTSPQQFSIAEDEDGSLSEPSTPKKKQIDCSAGSEQFSTPNSTTDESQHTIISPEIHNILPKYLPSNKKSYIPQSDIESEVEEPPTLRLEGISNEQLTMANEALKARMYKYKHKYSEVVQKYKELNDEKVKIENTLTESQDKALRRIAELREQCQLEQNAKAHLEENLRLILEEKEHFISVLQTKINLLKDGVNVDKVESPPQNSEELRITVEKANDSSEIEQNENFALKEKITVLQTLLEKCKDSIKDNKEKMTSLIKEKESISLMLDVKSKELDKIQGKEADSQDQLCNMQSRLRVLEQQQEESAMAMAETKKNMHEELEIKEQQLRKAKEEIILLQISVDEEKQVSEDLKKQHEETITKLQNKLKVTEKAMEEEKQNLMHELSRGKAAAVALMQQECAKKLVLSEEEWEAKVKEIQSQNENNLHDMEKEMTDKLLQREADFQKIQLKLEKLRSDFNLLENENKRLLEAEKEQAVKSVEGELNQAKSTYVKDIEKLKERLMQLDDLNKSLVIEKGGLEALQIKRNAEFEQLKLDLMSKIKSMETEKNKQNEQLSVLKESIKDRENIILQLKCTVSSTETTHHEKTHELFGKIKQLELEQEKLMLQAQERVSATEAKCRDDVTKLTEKINILQAEKKEVENLKSEIKVLNSQLDESLLVAEANRLASSSELSNFKAQLSNVQKQLADTLKSHSETESELLNKVKKLETENLTFLEDRKCLEVLKEEKELLNQKVQYLSSKATTDSIVEEITVLKEENARLQREVELLAPLKEEKELLNTKIQFLENEKKDLSERIHQIDTENSELKASSSDEKDVNSFESELATLREENLLLLNKVNLLEQSSLNDPNSAPFKQYMDLIKSEFEGKLSMKDTEMENKLKQLVKDFCIQMNVKDKDYDQIIEEVVEKCQSQEEQLLRNHRVEIASLRQDIFEKDCALEEMREHYEEIVQEKDSKLKEYESNFKAANLPNESNPEARKPEHSDWDDGWVVCEENIENNSPLHGNKTECAVHSHLIEELQEEVAKCNSEIKDLRILLRLSPPQSISTNNNYSNSSSHIPEPTEFEYLRNILFEYMMGKETLTLVKVIAAVLRFSEEQTQLVLQKEELRQTMKAHWLSFS